MSSVFLTAEWRNLVMLNFLVEPHILSMHIPNGTELDDWNGTTYISLVAFQFLNTKVMGWAVPFHRNFEEINLRFYVRFRAEEGWRRGVVFVKEVVPRAAIAAVARWLYNENYVALPTCSSLTFPQGNQPGKMEYSWKHKRQGLSVSARFLGEPAYPKKESVEEFISEHYWGYSSQRNGGTVEYQVEHPPWQVWSATEASVQGDMSTFYGDEFSEALSAKPVSAFIADGSVVSVYQGTKI